MVQLSRRARETSLLCAVRTGSVLLPRLPDRLVAPAVNVVGRLAWLANRSGRRAVQSNLRTVLSREPTVDEVRAVFNTAVANYVDLFRLPRIGESERAKRVDVTGWEHLTEALESGRGVLIASLHLGNIEAVGYAAKARGLSVVVPVERLEPPEFLEQMIALRERAGLQCIPVGRLAFAGIREALARNAIVGIGADRITVGNGESVSFCGRPARMPIAAAAVALRTGVPLLPIANERLPGGRYRCRIGTPITVGVAGSTRDSLVELTQRLLGALEGFLRENPTQWIMFRQIWND